MTSLYQAISLIQNVPEINERETEVLNHIFGNEITGFSIYQVIVLNLIMKNNGYMTHVDSTCGLGSIRISMMDNFLIQSN